MTKGESRGRESRGWTGESRTEKAEKAGQTGMALEGKGRIGNR
jgi:hypothetical protein